MLESAIPQHLRKERTCPLGTPPNYNPPFPAYCARFPTKMADLVMAIIGTQYSSPSSNDGAGIATIKHFITDAPEAVRPSFWEVASVTDKKGALNIAVLAYWPSVELHNSWEVESGFQAWWQGLDPGRVEHGWYQEVFSPTVDRFETVISNNQVTEGAADMKECVSGELLEHAYWGSMRDRLAVAQSDQLVGEKWGSTTANGPHAEGSTSTIAPTPTRIRVPGRQNLCMIRSGQDWSDTLPEERKLYLETMHPVLIKGMDFLRDQGREVGCYSMNLWDVVDPETCKGEKERTFGLGYFDNLSSLELWSKSHQTHINIFGGFLMYAKTLNNVLSLRLFHEVFILEPSQQFFEYVGCHDETSMLNSLRA
ncbi:phenylacetaldoxime dehydratase [Phaeosphaeriaceae sp. PMI808]|nr:phenylacetaldoxime dehydratase [Phaeosphaeriaceae sp. PMI808]